MPKRMYAMLELKPFDPCSFGVCLFDSSVRSLWGRSTMFLSLSMTIMFPLILLLWTLSVSPLVQLFWDVLFFAQLVLLLTWKRGISNSNSLSRMGWNTSLGKRLSCLLSPSHGLVIFLIKLDLLLCAYLKGVKESASWEATQFFFLFLVVLMIVNTVATSFHL